MKEKQTNKQKRTKESGKKVNQGTLLSECY